MEKYLKLFGRDTIGFVTADREFIQPVTANRFYHHFAEFDTDAQQGRGFGITSKSQAFSTQAKTVQVSINSEAALLITDG